MAFVYSTITIDMNTGEVLDYEGFNWSGEVSQCCGGGGANAQQKAIQQQQQQFFSTLTSDYSQQFAGQSAILQSLTNAFTPILQGGPGQFGFSAAETAAMRTQAMEGTGQAYTQASQAVGSQLAAAGGGNAFLPSGGMGEIEQELAGSAALQNAQAQLGITQAGYQQGYNQFMGAAQQLGGVAQQYDPTAYAGQATGAGSSAFGSATTMYQQQQAASPLNFVGGLVGGAVKSFAGGLGSAMGGGG